MQVLSDFHIKELLKHRPQTITDIPPPFDGTRLSLQDAEWNTNSSPIQPCSLDLHIGTIYVPDVAEGCLGSSSKPQYSFNLESGMSVVVMSHEVLDLPDDIGAIALPPSRISSSGILIANFGHIDPGYKGHLRFTLINMGKEAFALQQRALVMTLLLFQTSKVEASFRSRESIRTDDRPTHEEINRLAPDFANVRQRATEIAKGIVKDARMSETFMRSGLSAIVSAAVAAATAIGGFYLYINAELKKVDAVSGKLDILTERVNYLRERSEESRITTDLERRLSALEQALPRK